ncbi:MAG: putative glycoside hydrolase [Oscillospiraceae bacterium]|nr:putative glycoside hydrolase [Oscillospiraceae bacterium]
MARNSDFYRGRRRRRSRVLVPAAILLGLISLIVVLFYGMQKYAVITKDKVYVVPPMLAGEEEDEEPGVEAVSHEATEAEIIFERPDYSGVEAQAGYGLQPMRAIFVSADEFNVDKINEYANRLVVGNALLIELKPRSGLVQWDCKAWSATAFGLAGNPFSAEMRTTLAMLKEKGVYLAAQISICRDELYASRSTVVTLRNQANGLNYSDEDGFWLDAYNQDLRDYTVVMVKELYALGFDEVVLADVAHPVAPEGESLSLIYTRDMSTPPSAVNAVCGFAVSVAERLEDREGKLSIYVDSQKALVGLDSDNGQDGALFFKLFDRVYFRTDRYAYTFNVQDLRGKVRIGTLNERFVPVLQNYLPDNPDTMSWVLIDTETKP